MLEVSVMIFFP